MKEGTMAAFIIAASRMAAGFKAARPADQTLTPATYRVLAQTAERLPEYFELVAEALADLPRYQPKTQEETGLKLLGDGLCRHELRAFLRRTRLYAVAWEGNLLSASKTLDDFEAAARATSCDAVRLIPLDGLRISATSDIALPGGAKLRKLTAEGWTTFFEADLFDAPDTSTLSNLWALELRDHRSELTPNPIWIPFAPPFLTAMRIVGRWVNCINLLCEGFVRPVAVYTKPDTPLALKPVEVLTVSEPLLIPRFHEDHEWEEPFVSVDMSDAAAWSQTIAELDAGHTAADSRGPRVDTALHWFTRLADQLYGFEEGLAYGPSHEELLPDCYTVLEALLLTRGEKGKGRKIAERAAALVADDDSRVVEIQEFLEAAYALRNDLVHGDVRPSAKELAKAVEALRVWVKQVLVALLRLHGDLSQVLRGVDDPVARASNRALVPRY